MKKHHKLHQMYWGGYCEISHRGHIIHQNSLFADGNNQWLFINCFINLISKIAWCTFRILWTVRKAKKSTNTTIRHMALSYWCKSTKDKCSVAHKKMTKMSHHNKVPMFRSPVFVIAALISDTKRLLYLRCYWSDSPEMISLLSSAQ